MKIAALFSGGKDSTYSIFQVKKEGHEISCLITVLPLSDESHLLHFPNIEITKLQADSMKIPQLFAKADSIDTESEIRIFDETLQKVKQDYGIEGLIHGGILSEFQKKNFEKLCVTHDLKLISPVWSNEPLTYMQDLIESGFHFIMTSVSSDGLDESWLGKEITKTDLEKLNDLSKQFGFNLNFEGGEAETLVTDCPLFSHPLIINKAKKTWDGYRGRFEIVEAKLNYRARQS